MPLMHHIRGGAPTIVGSLSNFDDKALHSLLTTVRTYNYQELLSIIWPSIFTIILQMALTFPW